MTCWGCRTALLVWLALAPGGLMAETMRVRIAWGGGGARRWDGTISASQGTLSEPQPLGIEADEPGSMWLQPDPQRGSNALRIHQRSARAYDGVDLLVTATLQDRLLVQLTAADDPDQPIRVEVPLADLSTESFDMAIDARGNRLLVRRTPGDRLRVRLARDSLVFSPGEVFRLTLEPHLPSLEVGTKIRIKSRLVSQGGQEAFWSAQRDVRAGRPEEIRLEFPLPDQQGVYDLIITATHAGNWVRRPLKWNQTVTERKVQMLVLSPQPRVSSTEAQRELSQVGDDLDPANPAWWEPLAKLPKLPKIPRLVKGPLGNDNMSTWQHPLGEMVRLNPSRQSPDVSWEAYTLPIDRPGRPHVLEVDYPNDVSQTLGISILEPNAAGALMPIGLDSGVDLSKEIVDDDAAPRLVRHRLIFWPRTKTPLVLLSNLRGRSPAVYGKIRVLAGWEHLPRALSGRPPQGHRLLAAYLDRPLFPENFSALESLDHPDGGRSLDDWRTFYQGGTRLVEYLQHVGHDALMIAVLADGSTIYPSEILQPTPRYDTGVFFASGQDPVRKDVLEMLFRQFDREGLQLIPAIQFAAPLPELEAVRRRRGPPGETIEWIGPEGRTLCQAHPPPRGLAPYYNLLHPRVQEAMLGVVQELAGRYAHHQSFAGLAIQLSAQGYAQLPGPDWGMDDATIARFEQHTQLKLPGAGERRFAERAVFLAGENHRRAWLEWRAAELSRFYHRVHFELTSIRPGSRLYLAAADALTGAELEKDLRPALPRRTTLADALLRAGIDARHYQNDKGPGKGGIVLLRPERIISTGRPSARAVNLEIKQMPDVDDYFRGLSTPGSLFFHSPREVRIESFDPKSPFQPSYVQLFVQPVPSGERNRRRFVHSLATLDSQVMVDGGWLLPLGQEKSLQDLLAAYRHLPAIRFQQAGNRHGAGSSQPVTFRYGTHAGRTYAYAVNDAPFSIAAARVRVDAPPGCRLEELTGLRRVAPLKRGRGGTYWEVALQPYDLVAVRLSEPGVKFSQPKVVLPEAATIALDRRISELGVRTKSLKNLPPPLQVLANPGFERPPAGEDPLPGWATTQQPGVVIKPDGTQKHSGNQSVRMASDGPAASLVSQPFGPPATGRLSMSVWLRVPDPARQPPLLWKLQWMQNGQARDRAAAPQAVAPIGVEWTPYIFPIDDLPLEGLTELRVRFDLMGPGEVWVDDLQLFDLKFESQELTELYKLVTLARVMLQNGQVGDCLQLLDGYWPRFLEENIPLRPGALPLAPKPMQVAKPPEKPPPRTGFVDRVKSLLPKPLRF